MSPVTHARPRSALCPAFVEALDNLTNRWARVIISFGDLLNPIGNSLLFSSERSAMCKSVRK
jgi:hypothetical protein